MPKAHNIALKSFNANHSFYDVFRPSFSHKVVDRFLVDLKLANPSPTDAGAIQFHNDKRVLELAAGTGKFTKNLVDNGWKDNVVVVEPSEGMLTTFRQNFPQLYRVFRGSSYNIPVQDSSIDSVIIAQGFHWFSDLEALKEIRRVLKPDGTLGLIWNFDVPLESSLVGIDGKPPAHEFIYDDESIPEDTIVKAKELEKSLTHSKDLAFKVASSVFSKTRWSTEVGKFIYTYDLNVPQYRHGKWRRVLSETKDFGPISKETLYFYNLLDRKNEVFKYWETRSYITNLDEVEKQKIEKRIEAILEKTATDDDKVKFGNEEFLRRSMGTHAVILPVRK